MRLFLLYRTQEDDCKKTCTGAATYFTGCSLEVHCMYTEHHDYYKDIAWFAKSVLRMIVVNASNSNKSSYWITPSHSVLLSSLASMKAKLMFCYRLITLSFGMLHAYQI